MIPHKPILFVDRDGTILIEPKPSLQVDSFEVLDFVPGAISSLSKIQNELGYDLVLVSNQDGLGTKSLPHESFEGPHNLMLRVLKSEGIQFREILIDPSFPEENSPNRKPAIGLAWHYLLHPRLQDSYMVGDRATDMEFARNLGITGIYLGQQNESKDPRESGQISCVNWREIYSYLANKPRRAEVTRVTKETDIRIELVLEGSGEATIDTGLHFFDHMLEQLAKHGGMDVVITCKGDLEIDEHHTVEDVAIALGEALSQALGDKRGIERYAFVLPMDEARAEVLIDLSGRPHLEWDAEFTREYVGDVPTELFAHFFRSLAFAARMTLHMRGSAENEHHLIESLFKCFSRALRRACRREQDAAALPSTKGVL